MQILNKAYRSLSAIGVTPQMKIEEAQRVRLTNVLGSSPILVFLFYIYFGFTHHFLFLPILCFGLMLAVFAGLYCSYLRKPTLAKGVLFSVNSFSILITYNLVNIDYSVTCFFFPLILVYVMVYDVKKEWKGFLLAFAFTMVCLVSCFVVPKYLIYSVLMSPALLDDIIVLNHVLAFGLSIAIMFIIIKVNAQTHDKLIKAREESELANKAKSDFLSNMSHELRTPLNGIVGGVNLLMHEPATLSQTKYYEILQHSSDLMLNLVNHILDFSKINEGKVHLDRNVFNLRQMLSKLCRVYETQNTGAEVVFLYAIDERLDKDFVSDDLRLNQVLVNLLTNAKKFTKRGNVSFSARVKEGVEQELCVLFSVKDTGVGIRPEKLEKIFESFEQADNSTTRDFGGTGLGLSICRELVRLFGSTLHVTSVYGEGSEFFFELRLALHVEGIAAAETPADAIHDLSGLRVLVAEDNKVNMLVLRNFLRKWNVTPDEATNGAEALAKFTAQEYDVILLDIEMPVLDGYTAIQEIRKMDTEIPVVAFTAAFYDDMQNDLLARGFNDHVHKPFKPNELYDKLSRYKPAYKDIAG
jgi:signal transduction histidine kinase/ActR/RegA family two-component response regulator